jgi:hypothetical protein
VSEIGTQLIELAKKYRSLKAQMDFMQTLPLGGGGGIVALEYAEFTGTMANSTGAGNGFNITDLLINHAVSALGNKIYLWGQVGEIATSANVAQVGARLTIDGTAISVGDLVGSRAQVGAGGNASASANYVTKELFIMAKYIPTVITSLAYRLQGVNTTNSTYTVYINRTARDTNAVDPRAVSSLILMEVSL